MWHALTTDRGYARLHAHDVTYASGYSEAALRAGARKVRHGLRAEREDQVYFDDDANGTALRNVARLIELVAPRSAGTLRHRGRSVRGRHD